MWLLPLWLHFLLQIQSRDEQSRQCSRSPWSRITDKLRDNKILQRRRTRSWQLWPVCIQVSASFWSTLNLETGQLVSLVLLEVAVTCVSLVCHVCNDNMFDNVIYLCDLGYLYIICVPVYLSTWQDLEWIAELNAYSIIDTNFHPQVISPLIFTPPFSWSSFPSIPRYRWTISRFRSRHTCD